MLSIGMYEEMKMEKSRAFGCCPLLPFTLNVCPGSAISLHIVLAPDLQSAVSIIKLGRNDRQALVRDGAHKPSQGCHGNRLGTSTRFLMLRGTERYCRETT